MLLLLLLHMVVVCISSYEAELANVVDIEQAMVKKRLILFVHRGWHMQSNMQTNKCEASGGSHPKMRAHPYSIMFDTVVIAISYWE